MILDAHLHLPTSALETNSSILMSLRPGQSGSCCLRSNAFIDFGLFFNFLERIWVAFALYCGPQASEQRLSEDARGASVVFIQFFSAMRLFQKFPIDEG